MTTVHMAEAPGQYAVDLGIDDVSRRLESVTINALVEGLKFRVEIDRQSRFEFAVPLGRTVRAVPGNRRLLGRAHPQHKDWRVAVEV